MGRIFNFNPGPAVLPEPVLQKAQAALWELPGVGTGIMELSHRSAEFEAILAEAQARLRRLLNLGDEYHVLFCQGGARTQFAMVPMNFLHNGAGSYIDTGTWSNKAIEEARLFGEARVPASSADDKYNHIPAWDPSFLKGDEAFLHITSNNTIYGTQWHDIPDTGDVPLVIDMSSDIASREVDMSQFDLIYAGAQKNLGPAGVTLVLLKDSMAARAKGDHISKMLRYSTFVETNSLYNTPPVWNIYIVGLVLEWLEENGGIAAIEKANQEKADMLYNFIDENADFFTGSAQRGSRSLMNIHFNLPTPELEKQLVAEAKEAGYLGIKGHRILGGIRVSNYNAVLTEGVKQLIEFMKEFAQKNG